MFLSCAFLLYLKALETEKKDLTNQFVSDMVYYISNEQINFIESVVMYLNEILNQEKSIYLQISEMIENDILREVLLEDEKVPSTNELAKFFKINPATAAKGVNLLVDENILYKKRGIGMFVSKGAKEAVRKKRKDRFYENFVKTLLDEATGLGISREELVEMIRRQD